MSGTPPLQIQSRSITEDFAEIEGAVGRAGRWLLQNQERAKGGWAERKGDSPSSLNTAEVLLALTNLRESVPQAGRQIAAAARFLDEQQTKEGAEAGSWPRYVDGRPHCPDLIRTSLAVEALAGASEASPMPAVRLGAAWLVGARNADGGWGPRRGAESEVLTTSFALTALLAAAEAGGEDCGTPIQEGLEFLAASQHPNGCFDESGRLAAVRTAYAANCLQRGERCMLSVHGQALESALDWLEGNPVAATSEVEMTIEIDPDRTAPVGDYGFVFMTEAVVVRLLSESSNPQRRNGRLVREALEAVFRSMDPEGGFFGQRVFSWSTARAAYALGSARRNFDSFPEAPRLPSPRRVGHFILGFVVLVVASVVVLSMLGDFGPIQATVLMFLSLVVLIAYGRISETGFLEAMRALIPRGGRGAR